MPERDEKDFKFLAIGLTPEIRSLIDAVIPEIAVKTIMGADDFGKLLDQFTVEAGTYCLVSTATDEMGHLEVAQSLSSCYRGLHIVFITNEREKFKIDVLRKNGFNEYIMLPLDHGALIEHLEDLRPQATGGLKRNFKAVQLVDLQAGESLPFNVFTYLPMNNKYVALSGSGEISEKKFEKLRAQSTSAVYIDEHDVERFYSFAADKLMQLGQASNDSVSETEKVERLHQTVRSLFHSILDSGAETDFTTGRELAESASKVVGAYLKKKTGVDLGSKLKSVVGGESDSYARAQTVSAIACLLSLSTEIGLPEDLAIAGLFHHVGLEGINNEHEVNDSNRQVYERHPLLSLAVLKEKKISLSNEVGEMIEKHHERIDGKGFPNHLPPHKIPLTAQLLGYAEALEELTRRRPRMKSLTLAQAHEEIAKSRGLSSELLAKVSMAFSIGA